MIDINPYKAVREVLVRHRVTKFRYRICIADCITSDDVDAVRKYSNT